VQGLKRHNGRARLSIFAIALVGICLGTSAQATTTDSGHVRGVITFVGDSNESLAASSIELTIGNGDQPYAAVFLARPGAQIRTGDCPIGVRCATHNFWQRRINDANAAIKTGAYVVNLGINDTTGPGSPTGPGFGEYGAKIDWLMSLVKGRTVLWTNLPCSIEPDNRAVGCEAVNRALAEARVRWPNLVLLNWAAEADGHREYLLDGANRVHLSPIGQGTWSAFVKRALDQRFPN
jgi:hypothetical protein